MVPISIRVIWIIQIIISSVFFIFSVGHSPKASCFLANRLAVEHCSFIFVICLRRISLNEWLFLLWKYYNMVLCFNSKSEVRHVTMKPAVTTFSQPVFDRDDTAERCCSLLTADLCGNTMWWSWILKGHFRLKNDFLLMP